MKEYRYFLQERDNGFTYLSPEGMQKESGEFIDEMRRQGFNRESETQYGNAMLLVYTRERMDATDSGRVMLRNLR